MKDKTLQQWLEEMDKLDAEATKGPWHSKWGETFTVRDIKDAMIAQLTFLSGMGRRTTEEVTANMELISSSRTELPRALRVIKYLYAQLMEAEDYILVESWTGDAEYWEALQKMRNHHLKEIEKILNEEVG
mgnify:CR=1 FL=1